MFHDEVKRWLQGNDNQINLDVGVLSLEKAGELCLMLLRGETRDIEKFVVELDVMWTHLTQVLTKGIVKINDTWSASYIRVNDKDILHLGCCQVYWYGWEGLNDHAEYHADAYEPAPVSIQQLKNHSANLIVPCLRCSTVVHDAIT